MTIKIRVASAAMMILAITSCREADRPVGPGENARVEVKSDPPGAAIYLDGANTGKVTPDLLRNFAGSSRHEILVRMDRDNVAYGYRTTVDVQGDSLITLDGPLTMRCTSADCGQKQRTVGTMKIYTNPNGSFFNYTGSGG